MLVFKDGDIREWPHVVASYSPAEVVKYCVEDAAWQKFRLSMKGVSTPRKLAMLQGWMQSAEKGQERRTQVQVDNYINALKRGGQIGLDMKVKK